MPEPDPRIVTVVDLEQLGTDRAIIPATPRGAPNHPRSTASRAVQLATRRAGDRGAAIAGAVFVGRLGSAVHAAAGGQDDDAYLAGILANAHDVPEGELRAEFGDRIADVVVLVREDRPDRTTLSSLPRERLIRAAATREDPLAAFVVLGALGRFGPVILRSGVPAEDAREAARRVRLALELLPACAPRFAAELRELAEGFEAVG